MTWGGERVNGVRGERVNCVFGRPRPGVGGWRRVNRVMTWGGERVNGVMGERVNRVTGTLLEQSGEDTHYVHDVQAHFHYYKTCKRGKVVSTVSDKFTSTIVSPVNSPIETTSPGSRS